MGSGDPAGRPDSAPGHATAGGGPVGKRSAGRQADRVAGSVGRARASGSSTGSAGRQTGGIAPPTGTGRGAASSPAPGPARSTVAWETVPALARGARPRGSGTGAVEAPISESIPDDEIPPDEGGPTAVPATIAARRSSRRATARAVIDGDPRQGDAQGRASREEMVRERRRRNGRGEARRAKSRRSPKQPVRQGRRPSPGRRWQFCRYAVPTARIREFGPTQPPSRSNTRSRSAASRQAASRRS